jgi:uncharacterized membrane protein
MSRKKLIIRILIGLIIVVTVASIITYFVLAGSSRPWLAFYFACCGVILDLNFLLSIYLINKNVK